jgi:hypothetical protein
MAEQRDPFWIKAKHGCDRRTEHIRDPICDQLAELVF